MTAGSATEAEIASQPAIWRLAADLGSEPATKAALVAPGERVLAIGCGTSAHVALSYAVLREEAGLGLTDYAYASQLPGSSHDYDRVIAFSRSGTTTEILDALGSLPASWHRVVVTGVTDSPVAALADDVVDLGFADETSVVQTRFPTATLVAVRVGTGELDGPATSALIAQGEDALRTALPEGLGRGRARRLPRHRLGAGHRPRSGVEGARVRAGLGGELPERRLPPRAAGRGRGPVARHHARGRAGRAAR